MVVYMDPIEEVSIYGMCTLSVAGVCVRVYANGGCEPRTMIAPFGMPRKPS